MTCHPEDMDKWFDRNRRIRICFYLILGFFGITSCTSSEQPTTEGKTYTIGISQVGDEAWFQKMDNEMRQEALFHPEVQLVFRNAHYNYNLQCLQIDSFIAEKVDLLIVGPNDIPKLCEASNRAYDAGIPVVLTANYDIGEKCNAFICMSNYEIGQTIADYLNQVAEEEHCTPQHPLQVLEIIGPKYILPTELRTQGLHERLAAYPSVKIVASHTANWHRDEAFEVVDSLLSLYPDVRAIAAQNDEMAIGASEACRKSPHPIHITGVDAMTGKGAGIEAILNREIEASVMNTSRGDLVIRTAADILNGRPYEKQQYLPVVLVDESSPQLMLRLSDDINSSQDAIKTLQKYVDDSQQTDSPHYGIILLVIFIAVALIITGWIIFKNVKHNRHQVEARLDMLTEKLAKTTAAATLNEQFVQQLQSYIETHISDSDLTVEQLQKYLGIGRTQLFRKTKETMGTTPIELIRHIRLHRAQQMLKTTDLTIQEIAFDVGFTSPSYFTKCYKAEFGESPNKQRS